MSSYRRPTVISLLLLVVLGARPVFAASAQGSQKKLDRALLSAVQSQTAQSQPVIVRAKPGQIDAVRKWLKAHGDAVESEQPLINALSTKLTAAHLSELADLV